MARAQAKATVTDVAKKAGVSVSTVSYALSGSRPVRPETKAKIEKVMEELGYQPNLNARSLASRKTRVLALIYPSVEADIGPTLSGFVRASAARARANGHNLVLWPFARTETEEIHRLVSQGMADGVLVMEVGMDDPRIAALEEASAPYVMIGRTADLEGRHSVDIDFEKTIRDAVDYLTDLGHRNIVFVNHSEGLFADGYGPTVRAKLAFEQEIARRGLVGTTYPCADSPLSGKELAQRILAAQPQATAIVTLNELATVGLIPELQYRGKRVPEDISVVAIASSMAAAQMVAPTITTFAAPSEELGELAVDHLLSQLEDPKRIMPNVLVPCQLVEGGSAGPAKLAD